MNKILPSVILFLALPVAALAQTSEKAYIMLDRFGLSAQIEQAEVLDDRTARLEGRVDQEEAEAQCGKVASCLEEIRQIRWIEVNCDRATVDTSWMGTWTRQGDTWTENDGQHDETGGVASGAFIIESNFEMVCGGAG